MNKSNKTGNLEVSSDQLRAELIEIKERVGALETIASLANRPVVEKYVREHLTTDKGKQIMAECEEPRTREQLRSKLGYGTVQALDHHLKVLREDDLLHHRHGEDGKLTLEWSNLFKRLPKGTRIKILAGTD